MEKAVEAGQKSRAAAPTGTHPPNPPPGTQHVYTSPFFLGSACLLSRMGSIQLKVARLRTWLLSLLTSRDMSHDPGSLSEIDWGYRFD